MFAVTRLALAALAASALLPIPLAAPVSAASGDPNDALSCVEDMGIKGYGVRINNRCNFALRLATCVVESKGSNGCARGGQQEMFPVPADARDHVILDMQVSDGSKYYILACKDPWTPGKPHMDGGEYTADECAW